jgi:hypothetical protein
MISMDVIHAQMEKGWDFNNVESIITPIVDNYL